jgi:hypothetical protein
MPDPPVLALLTTPRKQSLVFHITSHEYTSRHQWMEQTEYQHQAVVLSLDTKILTMLILLLPFTLHRFNIHMKVTYHNEYYKYDISDLLSYTNLQLLIASLDNGYSVPISVERKSKAISRSNSTEPSFVGRTVRLIG